jgi:lipid A 4'-phosphatase
MPSSAGPRVDAPGWRLAAGAALTLVVVMMLAVVAVAFGWRAEAIDLAVAEAFHAWDLRLGGGQDDRWWWLLPYHLPALLSALLVAGGVAAVAAGLHRSRRHLLRPGLYVLAVFALGSGLLINAGLKEHLGRPRPRDTIAFGGTAAYVPPWAPSAAAGHSFPSGHASVPAMGIALWLLCRRRRRPTLAAWSLGLGAVLTAWIGAARLLAQAHWLSDIVWAVVLMGVVAWACEPLMGARLGASRLALRPLRGAAATRYVRPAADAAVRSAHAQS